MYKKEDDKFSRSNILSKFKRGNILSKFRGGRGSNIPSKKAQITIFIILGLLILFAFIFVMMLTSKVEKGQLTEAQEEAFSKVFKKEALRIFVEDCLTDELEQGLMLIGKQGRLWSDQPGGTKDFEEGRTGIFLGQDRVFYGIAKEEHLEAENSYPCNNASNAPEFCQYKYPNTKVGFGELELKSSTLQNDLRRYLINRTVWCVENFTRSNISSKAQIETEKIDLSLDIESEGIDVKVTYPLKFKLGEEEFFHISEFDFFYPTRFKDLLEAAVAYPLQMDWQYADFNYTKDALEETHFTYGNEISIRDCSPFKDYFLCNLSLRKDLYSSLAVEMTTEKLPNGDTVYVFESPNVINRPEFFQYRFVRQNRPPALDYIKRLSCPTLGYDYVVIKDEPELGAIDATAFALDPDEDSVSYEFSSGSFFPVPTAENHFYVPGASLTALKKGIYPFKAVSSDGILQDWQDVRVLVDRPLKINFTLGLPYSIKSGQEIISYSEMMRKQGEAYYLISNEDPIFINVSLPDESKLQAGDTLASVVYNSTFENFALAIPYNSLETKKQCYALPNGAGAAKAYQCRIDDYKTDIENWPEKIAAMNLPYFQYLTDAQGGKMNVSFAMKYCDDYLGNAKEVDVVVRECIPHYNPEHPFAYPYQEYKFGLNDDGTTDFENFQGKETINPFLATHSCCSPNFEAYTEGDEDNPCFVNPKPDCYGGIIGYTLKGTVPSGGYVLEQQERLCSGKRGNVCDGDVNYSLWNDDLVCGANSLSLPGCNGISLRCEGGLAWGYQPTINDYMKAGWCYGEMGCSKFCQSEVVYTGLGSPPSSKEEINIWAREKQITNDDDLAFYYQCGCSGAPDNARCDSNFDGVFGGVCPAGAACTEGAT